MNKIDEIIENARSSNRKALTEYESKIILKELGLNVTKQYLAKNKEEAIKYADEIGYPVVMKLMAEDIVHKSDVGAVRLNISTKEDAEKEFDALMNIQATGEKAVSVQEMAKKPITEIIIGSLQDPQFGPAVMFGIGGVMVEIMKDVSFRITPLTPYDAEEMIKEIKAYKILDGYRGSPKVDIQAIKETLLIISEFADKHTEIAEMDLNPVFAYENGINVVDARIILK
jgi:acyl-CoA synthetase (NDP forming)